MGCLSPTTVTAIKAKIEKLDAMIEAAETALLSAIGNSEIVEFRFDSGEGSQRTERRNPQQIEELLNTLESRKARLERVLNGTANVNMNLRRRRY